MLKLVAVSDLHLGEPDSVLHLRYPSLIAKFAQRLNRLAGASGEAAIDTLVLMGDIPDYTLASWETCHQNLRQLFDAILLGSFRSQDGSTHDVGVETRVRQVVYLIGNHDHALWSDALKQIVVPQGVGLREREGHPYGLGQIVVKDPALAAHKLRWVPEEVAGPAIDLEDRPFLHRTDGPGRASWSLEPLGGAQPVSLASYFMGREALTAVDSFVLQYPHLYVPIGSRGFLFQHGQYLSPMVVGKAAKYRRSKLEGIAPEVESPGGELESLLYDTGREKHPGLESFASSDESIEERLDDILQALPADELQLLSEGLNVKVEERTQAVRGLEVLGEGGALKAIKDKLMSLIRCFRKYRGKQALAEKTFLEVEEQTGLFMDMLWEPARNCDKPINDRFWNTVGRFEQLAETLKKLLGVQSNHELGDDFRYLIERYLEKCIWDLPGNVVFVYGDTHKALNNRRFDKVKDKWQVEVFNTGAWHSKVKNWQHGAKFFTVSENANYELEDIEFRREDLAIIRPFEEP
jgi:hypothetical protein